MEIDVVVKKKAVWWAWGDGGHQFTYSLTNTYPARAPIKVPGQLNNPLPHFGDLSGRVLSLSEEFSGWVNQSKHYQGIEVAKRVRVNPWFLDMTYFFLRRLKGNRIELDAEEVKRMRAARKSFLDLTDKEDDEENAPLIISEIAFYDEDLKFISSINVFMPLSAGMSMSLVIDTRTAAEKAASDAAWERSENDRAARGAMM